MAMMLSRPEGPGRTCSVDEGVESADVEGVAVGVVKGGVELGELCADVEGNMEGEVCTAA